MMSPPKYSPWLRLVWFGIGAAIVFGAFQTIVFGALIVAAVLSGADAREIQTEGVARYALWITVLTYPPLFGWLMFCRHYLDRRSLLSLGLRGAGSLRSFGSGALAGLLAILWLFGGLWVSRAVSFGGIGPEAFDRTPGAIAGLLLLHTGAFLAVAFMEEVVFRGYFLHNLRAAVGLRAAVWLQAVAFALVHLGNVAVSSATSPGANASVAWADSWRAMPATALVGAVFALMWSKTGSLWTPIGFHAAWNFFLGCVLSLPVSGIETFRLFDFQPVGSPWISGGSFGAECSLLLLPILGALWWLLNRLPDHPQALADLALLDPTHPAITATPLPAAIPSIETEAVAETAERGASRFQTSMRPREEEVAFPIIGQLPQPESAVAAVAPEGASLPPSPFPTDFSESRVPASPASTEWQFQPLPIFVGAPSAEAPLPPVARGKITQILPPEPDEEEPSVAPQPPVATLEGSKGEAPRAPRHSLPRW
jgi:membrane protease YdiL (CAAX protease family)